MVTVIDRDILMDAINIVLKAVSSKTTMPILECILIEASDSTVKLVSNNSELAIETAITECINITEPGSIALEARIFSDIIRKIEPGDITIKTSGSIVHIDSEGSKFKLQERDAAQFPAFPEVKEESCIKISQFALKEIIRDTIFSVSSNDSNKMMTGELFEVSENILKATSLDGHRISIRKIELKDEYPYKKAVIPGKTLNEISKIISDDSEKDVDISFGDNNIMFRFEGTVMVSRLIDGDYFRIDSMISNDYDTKVTVNKNEFIEYVERAVILLRESDRKPLVMNIKDGSMDLKINTFVASYNSDIPITKTGDDLLIGFNPRFILDALKVIDDEEVSMYMTNPKAPCFIRDEEGNYIYLILPINFNPAAYDY